MLARQRIHLPLLGDPQRALAPIVVSPSNARHCKITRLSLCTLEFRAGAPAGWSWHPSPGARGRSPPAPSALNPPRPCSSCTVAVVSPTFSTATANTWKASRWPEAAAQGGDRLQVRRHRGEGDVLQDHNWRLRQHPGRNALRHAGRGDEVVDTGSALRAYLWCIV